MRQCPSCGQEVSDSAVVCPSCARRLVGDALPASAPVSVRPRLSLRTMAVALVVFTVLIAAAVVAWFLTGGTRAPVSTFEPEVARVAPGDANMKVFVGCIGQTGEPNVFVMSVSRREEPDPRPAGRSVPPQPTTPGGVPLTGGTPPQPPVAGTGELPVAGAPLTRIETYVLDGSGGLTLSNHIGHAVEVTGVLERTPDRRFPRLQVSSARHIADQCPTP